MYDMNYLTGEKVDYSRNQEFPLSEFAVLLPLTLENESKDVFSYGDGFMDHMVPQFEGEMMDPSFYHFTDPTIFPSDANEMQKIFANEFMSYLTQESELVNISNVGPKVENVAYGLPAQMNKASLPKPLIPFPQNSIGTISLEERRQKIQKFLEKRKRRHYGKKISYACRKRVADGRLRIKGRFVTKQQADALRGKDQDNSGSPSDSS